MKPGTTADIYSINAATQTKVGSLGGGGSMNQGYSAMAPSPGVVIQPGQMGWMQNVHIRGGDFDQIGYEFDGVPVPRSYDIYATTTISTLGQQELQVYPGSTFQPMLQYPYQQNTSLGGIQSITQPLEAFFQVKFRL